MMAVEMNDGKSYLWYSLVGYGRHRVGRFQPQKLLRTTWNTVENRPVAVRESKLSTEKDLANISLASRMMECDE